MKLLETFYVPHATYRCWPCSCWCWVGTFSLSLAIILWLVDAFVLEDASFISYGNDHFCLLIGKLGRLIFIVVPTTATILFDFGCLDSRVYQLFQASESPLIFGQRPRRHPQSLHPNPKAQILLSRDLGLKTGTWAWRLGYGPPG